MADLLSPWLSSSLVPRPPKLHLYYIYCQWCMECPLYLYLLMITLSVWTLVPHITWHHLPLLSFRLALIMVWIQLLVVVVLVSLSNALAPFLFQLFMVDFLLTKYYLFRDYINLFYLYDIFPRIHTVLLYSITLMFSEGQEDKGNHFAWQKHHLRASVACLSVPASSMTWHNLLGHPIYLLSYNSSSITFN